MFQVLKRPDLEDNTDLHPIVFDFFRDAVLSGLGKYLLDCTRCSHCAKWSRFFNFSFILWDLDRRGGLSPCPTPVGIVRDRANPD